jgi:hypothetical protein
MWCLERDNLSIDLQPVEIPVEEWLNFNLQPRPYRAVKVEESFNPARGAAILPLMARLTAASRVRLSHLVHAAVQVPAVNDGIPHCEVVVMPDIASWLSRLGLDKYVRAFVENEIDLDALRHLSEDDLKELGLPVGPRRKVAHVAKFWRRSPSWSMTPCRNRVRRSSRRQFRPGARRSGGS